jgi:metal-dependent amidase/aminoacylase/carboxypeptidase family protein
MVIMAYYLQLVPGTYFFLGGTNKEKNITYPHHNCKFDVDEDVFWKGTALLAQCAVDWLKNNK